MEHNFSLWCQKATEKIRYGPDRRVVSQELMDHLEDHREALMEQGLTREEAERKALDSMGSAEAIASQLAAIHTPWLGYLSSFIMFVAILTGLFAVYLTVSICGSFLHTLISSSNFDSIPANHGSLDYYAKPNVSDSSDGYRFRITEVGYKKSVSTLYVELETINWPWMDWGGISRRVWAIDSNGNYYDSIAEAEYDDPTRIHVDGGMSSSMISLGHMKIVGFDPDAQWVELHYDRDGRDIVLRIDLTGGKEHG